LREIVHLRMALESFTTAALEICCVSCVTKEVGVAHVRSYLHTVHPLGRPVLVHVFENTNEGGVDRDRKHLVNKDAFYVRTHNMSLPLIMQIKTLQRLILVHVFENANEDCVQRTPDRVKGALQLLSKRHM